MSPAERAGLVAGDGPTKITLMADDVSWFEGAFVAWENNDFVGVIDGLNEAVNHFAALATHPGVSRESDGWQLVPIEATEAMLSAWFNHGAKDGKTLKLDDELRASRRGQIGPPCWLPRLPTGWADMGPAKWAMDFADYLIDRFDMTLVDRYALAYDIQHYCETTDVPPKDTTHE